jgi:hypothetical protein
MKVKDFGEVKSGKNPAMVAGVRVGDVIEAVNNELSDSSVSMREKLKNCKDFATLTIVRGMFFRGNIFIIDLLCCILPFPYFQLSVPLEALSESVRSLVRACLNLFDHS